MTALWLFLAIPALACNSTVTSDLIVDASVAVGGDGSECFPFRSLSAAVFFAASFPRAKITVLPSAVAAELESSVSIANELEVEGLQSAVVVRETLRISHGGTLKLSGLSVFEGERRAQPMVVCEDGELVMDGLSVISGLNAFLELIKGNVAVTNSRVGGCASMFLGIFTSETQTLFENTTITNCSNLINLNTVTSTSTGFISLKGIIMEESGTIIYENSRNVGAFEVEIRGSIVLKARQQLIFGMNENTNFQLTNVTLIDIYALVFGALSNSTFAIRHSQFSLLRTPLFDINALLGSIHLHNVTVTDCLQGPLINLPLNPNPFHTAFIAITDSRFVNVTNAGGSGLVFCCEGATLAWSHLEVASSFTLSDGLFYLEQGIVSLAFVQMRDCSSQNYGFFRIAMSEAVASHSVVQRLNNSFWCSGCCLINSNCDWTNVTIADMIEEVDSLLWNIYLTSLFGSNFTVQDCNFSNKTGYSRLLTGASDNSRLVIARSTFANSLGVNLIGSYRDSTVTLINITLIRPVLTVMITCVFSTNCVHFVHIRIVGESRVAVMLNTNGGLAVLEDVEINGISDTVVRGVNANVQLADIRLRGLTGKLCKSCIQLNLTLIDCRLEGVDSALLLELFFSKLVMRNVTVKDVVCQQFFVLEFSQIIIENGNFSNLRVYSFGGVLEAISCDITINSTVIDRVESTVSLSTGLIYLESSILQVLSIKVSHFDSTLIKAVNSPVIIAHSDFSNGGLATFTKLHQHGTVLWSEFSQVTIQYCRFTNITAESGGAMYIKGSGTEVLAVDNVEAVLNSALKMGGFLLTENVNVKIRQSQFENNTATSGGALAVLGKVSAEITDSRFHYNFAGLSGGALQYQDSANFIIGCEWDNNTAKYGSNMASEVSTLFVIERTSLKPIFNFSIEAVSGQLFTEEINIGCFDDIGQIVSTDHGSKLELVSTQANSTIIISKLLESVEGTYLISAATFVATPNTSFTVYGTYKFNITVPLFDVYLRECFAGESFSDLQCKVCSSNTYSLRPSELCKLCPDNADCPGGWQLHLHEGHWRAGNLTDEIYHCLLPHICRGGLDSECEAGHQGIMCEQCSEEYYKVNQLQCASCGHLSVSIVRGMLGFVLSFVGLLLFSLRTIDSMLVYVVIIDYLQSLRIILNFKIYWPKPLAHLYSIVGDLGSFGLTAFTNSCFSFIGAVSKVYSQCLTLFIYFGSAGILIASVRLSLSRHSTTLTARHLLALFLYFLYLLLPMILLRSLQLFSCFPISGREYLLYDSSEECWTAIHTVYTLSLSLPCLCLCLLSLISLISILSKSILSRQNRAAYWKAYVLLLLLLRRILLTLLLTFANALALCTQVGVALIINLAVEALLSIINSYSSMTFFHLYQSILLTNTMLFFVIAIYSASDSFTAGSEAAFIVANCVLLILPGALHLMVLCSRAPAAAVSQQPLSTVEIRLEVNSECELRASAIECPGAEISPPHNSPSLCENFTLKPSSLSSS